MKTRMHETKVSPTTRKTHTVDLTESTERENALIPQLEADHRELQALLESMLSEDASDVENTKAIFEGFKKKLSAHSKAEESVLYSTIRRCTEADDQIHKDIMEGFEEHHVVDILLSEAASLNPVDEEFRAKVTVIAELLDHHIEEEEDELFKKAEKLLGKDQMYELGRRFAQEKKSIFVTH